jgi:hypothetical protein
MEPLDYETSERPRDLAAENAHYSRRNREVRVSWVPLIAVVCVFALLCIAGWFLLILWLRTVQWTI